MHLSALLDVDLVAVEAEDQVSVLLEIEAPSAKAPAKAKAASPRTLQVVLDRSGSMGDGRLDAAKDALDSLITRLDPADNFGLVVFDHEVEVPVPAAPLSDKEHVRHLIRQVDARGSTNLSGGLLRGFQEARRVKGKRDSTLLLLSDGHANDGILDPQLLEKAASDAQSHGVSTSTVGLGLGYDESLLACIAKGGRGNTVFAEDRDAAGAAVASEVDNLLDGVAQAASLTVRPTGAVSAVHLYNDIPGVAMDGGFMVELGDFYSGESRKLLMTIDVPAMAGLGLEQVCELELRWVDIQTLDTHTANIPIHVNVVPGDEAAGRIPNATVTTELAFQRAQRAKQAAVDAIRQGDVEQAKSHYRGAALDLGAAYSGSPPEMADEIAAEAVLMHELADQADSDANHAAKRSAMDAHYKNRTHGRRRPDADK